MNIEDKIQWCIEQHRKTNHFYDTYLPYEFHLRMVVKVAEKFGHLISRNNYGDGTYFDAVKLSCWGHDLIEDTRTSYNDVMKVFKNDMALNIVYAVTNEKGKNRSERANDKYYDGIRKTKYATFVKLCDRIANVQYSKMTASKMFEMYKKENKSFVELIYSPDYIIMFDCLDGLFSN